MLGSTSLHCTSVVKRSSNIPVYISCLSYFSLAVTKYQDQAICKRKHLMWAPGFRGLESVVAEYRCRQEQLRAHVLVRK